MARRLFRELRSLAHHTLAPYLRPSVLALDFPIEGAFGC
ncbi:MAG: hypothetical protein K0S65_3811, partial [Labilithrix sp.]|nr:hypothetical protein [Labilithrix sp.]